MRSLPLQKAAVIIFAVLGLVGWTLPFAKVEANQWMFINLSYYILSFVFFAWVGSSIPYLKNWARTELTFNSQKKAFLYCVIFSAISIFIIVHAVPFDLKINSDEANLLSVANSFFLLRQPFNIVESKTYFDTFHATLFNYPKRPLLFPYLIHLVHLLNGMRASSAFITNLTAVFFFSVIVQWRAYQRSKSFASGVAALLLIFSQPVFLIFATCAGFDSFSCIFLFSSLWLGQQWIREVKNESPDQSTTLPFFLLTLVAYSHIRYENPLIAGIILLSAALLARRFQFLLRRWEVWFCFASLSIHLWQHNLTPNSYESPADVAPFSVQYLIEHSRLLFQSIPNLQLPYNTFLLVILLIAGPIALFWKKLKFSRDDAILFTPPILAQLLIILSLYWGTYNHPAMVRFFIPLLVSASIFCYALFSQLWPKRTGAVLVFALANFTFFAPQIASNDYLSTLTLNRDIRYLTHFLETQHSKRILVIYSRPVQFAALGYGSLSVESAKKSFDEIITNLGNGLFDHVYYFEETSYNDAIQKKGWGETNLNFKEIAHYQQVADQEIIIYELKPRPL